MKRKWDRLINKVDKANTALSIAIQEVESQLVFEEFKYDDKPTLSMSSSGELLLSWHRFEMFPITFIEIMETRGFITPEDF